MNEAWTQQPEVTQFTPEQQATFLELVGRLGRKRTGGPNFKALGKVIPQVANELAVHRVIDGVDHGLMWYRDDEEYVGWHIPGGYILEDESDEEWIRRVLRKESGLELISYDIIRRFNNRRSTGWVPNHQMSIMFWCKTKGEPSNGMFFPLTSVPQDTLGHHVFFVQCMRAHLLRQETMREKGIRHDYIHKAPQWQWMLVSLDTLDGWETCTQFNSLDEAVARCREAEENGGAVYLVDDQGLQIL